MWSYIQSLMHDAAGMADHMDREHWIAVFIGVLIVGAFLLRGFGLRTGGY